MANPSNPPQEEADVQKRYDELFKAAVAAVFEAGWGSPKTHDELVGVLQTMAIPGNTY